MPVLDHRVHSVMASPMRSYAEGKAAGIAMRNQAALADMNETAARDDHAGQALDINRGNMEAAQANVVMRQKEFTKSLQAHMMTMSKEAREEDRAEATQALSVYQSAFEKTKDPNAAAEIALQFTDIDGTTPEQREQINQMAESLGGMDKLLESYIAADDDFKTKKTDTQENFEYFVENLRKGGMPDEQLAEIVQAGSIDKLLDQDNGWAVSVNKDGTVILGQGDQVKSLLTDSHRSTITRDAVETYRNSSSLREGLISTLSEVRDFPRAAGATGLLAERFSGLLTNAGSPEFGDTVAKMISGAGTEQLATIRTQLQALRGKVRPIATAEEGARISETERKIAGQIYGYLDQLDGISDLTQAYTRTIPALKQLTVETLVTQYQKAKDEPKDLDVPYDLNTQDGATELFTMLGEAGFSDEMRLKTYSRLLKIQGAE